MCISFLFVIFLGSTQYHDHQDTFSCILVIKPIYRKRYLDDDDTGFNPKILQIGMRYTPSYYPIQQMWDRDRKIARDNFGKKRKLTGFIYLPGSKFREAEGHLMMRSFLQDAVINCAPRIGK